MSFFTQPVFIPRPLYALLPVIYLAAGLLMWLTFDNTVARTAGLFLVAFAILITFKRFKKPAPAPSRRRRY